MISIADMERRARSYLRAARILSQNTHAEYDAAAYLCGYAVEIALKAQICRTLGWAGFPETIIEFQPVKQYKTHDLVKLLQLSGKEPGIKQDAALLTDWSVVSGWNPEQRYDPLGTKTDMDARAMTAATVRLLRFLL